MFHLKVLLGSDSGSAGFGWDAFWTTDSERHLLFCWNITDWRGFHGRSSQLVSAEQKFWLHKFLLNSFVFRRANVKINSDFSLFSAQSVKGIVETFQGV